MEAAETFRHIYKDHFNTGIRSAPYVRRQITTGLLLSLASILTQPGQAPFGAFNAWARLNPTHDRDAFLASSSNSSSLTI